MVVITKYICDECTKECKDYCFEVTIRKQWPVYNSVAIQVLQAQFCSPECAIVHMKKMEWEK